MGLIINLNDYRIKKFEPIPNDKAELTSNEVAKLEKIRDGIEKLLNTASTVHGEPLGVALAAGRYAAMKLYQMHGRAETIAFLDNCIQTVEIAEDISAK